MMMQCVAAAEILPRSAFRNSAFWLLFVDLTRNLSQVGNEPELDPTPYDPFANLVCH